MDKLSVLHPSPSWSGFWLPRHSLIDCGPGPHQFAKGRHSMLDDFPWNYMAMDQYLLYNTIFRGMNIHKSQLFWCELQGYKVLTHCHISLLCINRIFMDFQCISKERWKDQISNIEPYWACSWGFGQERNCTSTRCPSVKVHLLPVDMFAWHLFFTSKLAYFFVNCPCEAVLHIYFFFLLLSPPISPCSHRPRH